MFLSDGEFPNVNKFNFLNENLYFTIMMIEQNFVVLLIKWATVVVRHWPTMAAISSESIKPLWLHCVSCIVDKMILIDSKPCRYQILLISKSGCYKARYKVHTNTNNKAIIFNKTFEQLHIISYLAFGQIQKDFWERWEIGCLDKLCISTIYYIVSQVSGTEVLSYWSFMTHHWDFI